MKKIALLAALAAAGISGSASAAPIDVAFNIATIGGVITVNTGDVTTAQFAADTGSLIVSSILAGHNNIGLTNLTSVTLAPATLGLAVGSVFTKTFTANSVVFTENLTVSSYQASATSLGIDAVGTISGAGFDPTTVFYSASYTQNGGPGAQINVSYNDSTVPPPGVPEPATLGLLGLGLLGLGAVRRKA